MTSLRDNAIIFAHDSMLPMGGGWFCHDTIKYLLSRTSLSSNIIAMTVIPVGVGVLGAFGSYHAMHMNERSKPWNNKLNNPLHDGYLGASQTSNDMQL